MKTYAQNFEDVILWRALKNVENGFFIDVGAHHPIKDSVSKIFSDAGWSGIHVEPVPSYADLLRKDRPNDTILEAIVSDKNGLCEFYNIEGTGLSTSNKEIADSHKTNNFEYSSIIVSSITFDNLLSISSDHEIHWLKIDVEGTEKAVLRGWTDVVRRPWVVVIEATVPGTQMNNFSDWENLILEKGYSHVYSDGLNRFYLSKDHPELSEFFKLPPNIFDGFQLTPESDYAIEIVRAHQHKVADLEAHFATLEQSLRSQTDALERELSLSRAAKSRQEELETQCEQLREQLELKQQAFADLERELQRRKDEAVADAYARGRDELEAALQRERVSSLDAAAQRQELEHRCARLHEKMEAMQKDFLSQERSMQSRTEEIISIVRTEAREQVDAALKRERISAEKVATEQAHWEQRCVKLEDQLNTAHAEFAARERQIRTRTDELMAAIRQEAKYQYDEALERERALSAKMAMHQDEFKDQLLAQSASFRATLDQIITQNTSREREYENKFSEILQFEQKRNSELWASIAMKNEEIDIITNAVFEIRDSITWKIFSSLQFFTGECRIIKRINEISSSR